jgi:hypothetical protein
LELVLGQYERELPAGPRLALHSQHDSQCEVNDSFFLIYFSYNMEMKWKLHLMFFELRFSLVRFESFTALTMKNGVFWDVMPCGSCKNRHFRGA